MTWAVVPANTCSWLMVSAWMWPESIEPGLQSRRRQLANARDLRARFLVLRAPQLGSLDAHVNAARSDGVNPGLLGMTKTVGEDSVSGALKSLDAEQSGGWLKKHLKASYELLQDGP